MKDRNVERLLADPPAPPPPKDLAERIKNEIPDDLELSPELLRSSRVVPMRRRRRWYVAAAAAVTIALAGTVTWQMRETRLSTAVFEAADQAQAKGGEMPSDIDAAPSLIEVVGRDQVPETAEGAESVGGLADRVDEVARDPAPRRRESKVTTPASAKDAAPADKERSLRASGKRDSRAPAVDAEEDLSRGLADEAIRQEPAASGRITADDDLAGDRPNEEAFKLQKAELEKSAEIRQTEELQSSIDRVRSEIGEERSKKKPMAIAIKPYAEEHPESQTAAAPSTGGTSEPNDQPYGDVFYREYGVNPFVDTEDDRLSTFGLDVDTGSYTVARRYLRDGHLPPREAIRVEEFLNSYDYGDRPPRSRDFQLTAEGGPSPFAEGERYYLLRFAVSARKVAAKHRPPAVLTFVVDTSGSMNRENRLDLVKVALYELLNHLRADDQVGLVAYGSRGEVLLEPTADRKAIKSAIRRLQAGGSTNAEEGLLLAYELAHEYSVRNGINRIILCSDGVANVGRTGPESILEQIQHFTDAGIELTTVGFGMGNYNDVLMEQLADTGDGRYSYVDVIQEARRIFVEELTGTLMTIGYEAKAQVEFNPDVVSRYRLLGYENRDIADQRFRDPTVDAGEIGSGHTVTALYEIKLQPDRPSGNTTLATLRLRYRPRGSDLPVEMEKRMRVGDLKRSWNSASWSLRFAALVAEFAEILKGTYWARDGDLREVLVTAQQLSSETDGGARMGDFVSLVAAAAEIVDDSRR